MGYSCIIYTLYNLYLFLSPADVNGVLYSCDGLERVEDCQEEIHGSYHTELDKHFVALLYLFRSIHRNKGQAMVAGKYNWAVKQRGREYKREYIDYSTDSEQQLDVFVFNLDSTQKTPVYGALLWRVVHYDEWLISFF